MNELEDENYPFRIRYVPDDKVGYLEQYSPENKSTKGNYYRFGHSLYFRIKNLIFNYDLISDSNRYFKDSKHTEEIIKKLASRGIKGSIIQILDPAEKTFPFKGRINFTGLKQEESILIGKAESVRNSYKRAITSHCDKIKRTALSYSWKYFTDTTGSSPELSLLNICSILSNYNSLKLDA